jgi:hypothetical protein
MMTRERALDIIQDVWGHQTIISKSVIDEVAAEKIDPNESDLATLSRVAELPVLLTIKPFNTSMVFMLCGRVRFERAIEKATRYRIGHTQR